MIRTNTPVLYIFSGLPGVGKSSLARLLAGRLGCVCLRIDTIEQSIRDLYSMPVEGEGYRISYRIAADNLRVGISVVADSCNPIELTRTEWENVARMNGASHINIEVCCMDKAEHRTRVETRVSSIPNLRLPTWAEVEQRLYHPWSKDRIIVETCGKTVDESFGQLCNALAELQVNSNRFRPTSP
jgi:predicted kinase